MTPEEEIDFIQSILEKGFHYDRLNDEYVRKWSTETGPKESILEIYKKIYRKYITFTNFIVPSVTKTLIFCERMLR